MASIKWVTCSFDFRGEGELSFKVPVNTSEDDCIAEANKKLEALKDYISAESGFMQKHKAMAECTVVEIDWDEEHEMEVA